MKICDLHGLRFDEGKDKIIFTLNSCIIDRDYTIQVIHGFHGHVFRDYIQSPKFRQFMKEEGFYFKEMDISENNGWTKITLDME